jgi:glycosyltransferase involved in cell wall biosynthesis
MRIVLVTTSYPAFDGDPAGHFVRAEARELERSGHEVVVVAPSVTVRGAFGWPGVAARVREDPRRLISAAAWVARARAEVKRLEARRVVAHWAVPCAWPVGVAADVDMEVVSHGGDVRLLLRMPRPVRARLTEAIAVRASSWRFVSAALRDALVAALPGDAAARVARIATVRAASIEVPVAAEAVARKARALGGRRVGVSVGRLVPSKRVDRAIEHVARTREVDALVVVGDGPERGRLEALAAARGVDARFVGLVPREEALAWIGAASCVLFASEAEGASTVLREAEALGTRVVFVG